MFKKYKQLIIGFLLGALVFGIVPVGATVQEYLLKKSDAKLMVDGKEFANKDLPVLNYKGYNYIPAATFREICDTIGVGFEWFGEKKEIQIDTKKNVSTQERKGDSVENIVKDGYNLVVENGVEYVGLHEIVTKYEQKGYAFRFNKDKGTYSLEYNPYENHPIDEYEMMFDNISVKVFSGRSHIEYSLFKENLLPILEK